MKLLYAGVVELDGERADKIHFVSLARELRALGHDLVVVAHGRSCPPALDGMEVHLLPRTTQAGAARPWYDLRLLATLTRLRGRADFAALYHRGVPLANRWARLARLPSVVEINGIHTDELAARGIHGPRLQAFAQRERAVIAGATRTICVTDGLRRQMIERFGVRPEHCIVIQNGVDTALFTPRPRAECLAQTGLPADAFHVGFVGAFQAWIDFTTLLAAAESLHAQGVPLRLTLVGDGPAYATVAAQIAQRGLAEVVQMTGRVPHSAVPVWMNAFDVCLAPSSGTYIETIGKSSMKLFEYMACARPVVLAALPGEGDLMIHAQAGLVYPPGDAAALAAQILTLYRAPERRAELGARARAFVVQQHSWRRVAEQTVQVLGAALGQPNDALVDR